MIDKRIRKEQLEYLVRPVVYALLLVILEGLTTDGIALLLNNTPGIRRFSLSRLKLISILKTYKSNARSVFIQRGDKWLIRDLVGGHPV